MQHRYRARYTASLKAMYFYKFGVIVPPVEPPANRELIGGCSWKIQAQFSQPRTSLLVKFCTRHGLTFCSMSQHGNVIEWRKRNISPGSRVAAWQQGVGWSDVPSLRERIPLSRFRTRTCSQRGVKNATGVARFGLHLKDHLS